MIVQIEEGLAYFPNRETPLSPCTGIAMVSRSGSARGALTNQKARILSSCLGLQLIYFGLSNKNSLAE